MIPEQSLFFSAVAMSAEARVSKWYFGGLASAGAACFTHPLDLLKVGSASCWWLAYWHRGHILVWLIGYQYVVK